MYKIILSLLVAMTMFACAPVDETQSLKPITDLSYDAKQILDILDGDMQLFEIYRSNEAKSRTIQLWIKEDGEWIKGAAIAGNYASDAANSEAYALLLKDKSIDIKSMTANGRYSLNLPEMNFKDYSSVYKQIIDEKIDLELDQEYLLALKYATNDNSIIEYNATSDFREVDAPLAYAITIVLGSSAIQD